MNVFVEPQYVEDVYRLALGLEPIDGALERRIGQHVNVVVEQVPAPVAPSFVRHGSCLFVLIHGSGVIKAPVDLRFVDATRRFVPRRLRIPVATEAQVLAAEAANAPIPVSRRRRRPFLFPGAAYDVTDGGATGLRGSVQTGGKPLRWARVEARLSTGQLLGRAHGDDRGEFLLVIGQNPVNFGSLRKELKLAVDVTAFGPAVVPPLSPDDPFADLPREDLPAPGLPDPVSTGAQLPAGYTRTVTQTLDLSLGRLNVGFPAFDLP